MKWSNEKNLVNGENVSLKKNRKGWSFILNWIKTVEYQRTPSDAVEIGL